MNNYYSSLKFVFCRPIKEGARRIPLPAFLYMPVKGIMGTPDGCRAASTALSAL